jgi:NADPH-dependent 2,4-dienoyl-CoA reductase/sulfur reductase-like enzyme/nitrite reductase/ring-hydroxylating ferredoxin subunit
MWRKVQTQMSKDGAPPSGPDLREGIPLSKLTDGEPVFGHVGDTPVFIIRQGDGISAFDAVCTHYGAALADGIVHEGTLRCPWHHACFSLEDGDVLGGPALDPLSRRSVSLKENEDRVTVGDILKEDPLQRVGTPTREPDTVIIVGAGAAGTSAAETLRREGYKRSIILIDSDPDAPYDRPNLSKDYLAGEAPEDWILLRPESFFSDRGIQRIQGLVSEVDPTNHQVLLDGGRRLPFGALILAPGSRPRTLPVPGSDLEHVHTLRSLADCRAIIESANSADSVAVIGASFIGMEVAASLKARGLPVTVIAPEKIPFQSVLGEELGTFIKGLHEEKGVSFRLESTVTEIRSDSVLLEDGSEVEADLVVVGIGVDPDLGLARKAGLKTEDGIVVDEFLRTSHIDVYAVGDVARYPEPRLGRSVRIEHWAVAQRQGRTAARNILGKEEPFTDVPFFWTKHFGTPVAYVGHGEGWDEVSRTGDCGGDGCSTLFQKNGKRLALATVFQDKLSLRTEAEMEKEAGVSPLQPSDATPS